MMIIPRRVLLIILSIFFFTCDDTTIKGEIETKKAIIVVPEDKQIEILEAINRYRISKGYSSLIKLDIIKSQTQNHTSHMIQQSKISHENFLNRMTFLNNQAEAKKVGENVARGYTTSEALLEGWLTSETHKNTMEDKYTHFNITAEQNEYGIWFYTNIFIKK